MKPLVIYINWGAYDELSDANSRLSDRLAIEQLDHVLRLRDAGVPISGYLMDAAWHEPDSGYTQWRRDRLPGGDTWLERVIREGLTPGLWFGSNNAWPGLIGTHPAWEESLSPGRGSACCFVGGFMDHFVRTLRSWYDRGVRHFKFDFFDRHAAPAGLLESMLPSEITAANITAFSAGLQAFRHAHSDVLLMAYNGFEETPYDYGTQQVLSAMANTSLPFRRTLDTRWLEVFDTVYCGDPRPADLPMVNFWRSKDLYSDHMVRVYQRNGYPLSRIDNCGFMIGNTGTCYQRGKAAWKGTLLLMLARGGCLNAIYGDLGQFNTDDAAWMSRAVKLMLGFQSYGCIETFGEPGRGEPYGYIARDQRGAVVTLVNPAQQVRAVPLPRHNAARLLFQDTGHTPALADNTITLSAEHMAVVGLDGYAHDAHDLGESPDPLIPHAIHPLGETATSESRSVTLTATPKAHGTVRVLAQQFHPCGWAYRSTSPKSMDQVLVLEAKQGDHALPVRVSHNRVIWSGLSWAAGRFEVEAHKPVTASLTSHEPRDVRLTLSLYTET